MTLTQLTMTMRWYGTNDPVTLQNIRQIPVVKGIVSALHDVPVGEVWTIEHVQATQQEIEQAGLSFDVIESIFVHDAIKLGTSERDQHIESYSESIRNVGRAGIGVVCYNFMPVFDWMRTDLAKAMPDQSTTLEFQHEALQSIDLDRNEVQLPGWGQVYSGAELRSMLTQYRALSADDLFDNLVYFLKAVVPVAREANVKLALHPDDPPWSFFGIPRIVSTASDYERIFEAVPDTYNGITFCSGSLGSRADNDLLAMIGQFSDRIHFVHLRNVIRTSDRAFYESTHSEGDVDLKAVISALIDHNVTAPIRPDHGRMIWGETGRAGYGLYDRALGAMYLSGIRDALESEK